MAPNLNLLMLLRVTAPSHHPRGHSGDPRLSIQATALLPITFAMKEAPTLSALLPFPAVCPLTVRSLSRDSLTPKLLGNL